MDFFQPTEPADMLGEHKTAPAIKAGAVFLLPFSVYSLAAFFPAR